MTWFSSIKSFLTSLDSVLTLEVELPWLQFLPESGIMTCSLKLILGENNVNRTKKIPHATRTEDRVNRQQRQEVDEGAYDERQVDSHQSVQDRRAVYVTPDRQAKGNDN